MDELEQELVLALKTIPSSSTGVVWGDRRIAQAAAATIRKMIEHQISQHLEQDHGISS